MAVSTRQLGGWSDTCDVLDLRHFSSHDLRPLLEAEAREWDRELRWDYSGSAEMILRYADSRILPGYAILEARRVCAYSFYVYEGNKAVIGDCYALGDAGASRRHLQDSLAEHVIETLQQTPGITRIEAQLLLQPAGTLAGHFGEAGFEAYRRLFMVADVPSLIAASAGRTPGNITVRRWQENDFQASAGLITRAYAGHVDSIINDQYRTAAGSLRFLNNIVRFPGCGSFDPASSFVATDESSGVVVGLLLCSRVRKDVAHVTQVCLLPQYRGIGLGRHLIGLCAQAVGQLKLPTLTLTVTERNFSAVELYKRLGFVTERTFDAFVWER